MDLRTQYQQFIHRSRYARWLDDKGRRETWEETVNRYVNFMCFEDGKPLIPREEIDAIEDMILHTEILPSMRALMTAGPALARCNVAGYNCAYTPIDDPKRFSEVLYILMCGTGVGFSCERQEIAKLPEVPGLTQLTRSMAQPCAIGDSKDGWASAYAYLIASLYAGEIPMFDYSDIRPAGARLKTMGGRASGPGPLRDLFDFTVATFKAAQGRKLTSLEVHDLVCKIGEIVVVGGVRRSAEISLSNLSDQRMALAKAGAWWETAPHRALANNSAVYDGRPDVGQFMAEWLSLYNSKSGERGIFNREACNMLARRVGRATDASFGTNPCSEIILRPQQFCNLTEVVVRSGDSIFDIAAKVYYATILGTLQARLTDFKFLSPEWRKTTESEALLGVSLTGIYDGPALSEEDLEILRATARDTNIEVAKLLDINPAASITCVKPSGTVSQLADCASGIHPRHSQFYIRRVRGDVKDPLTQLLKDQGVPWEPCVLKPQTTVVFSFPQRAPDGAVTRNDVSAIAHLEKWLHYQKHWCDHKPSVTITVREDEWPEVGAWVWKNFDWMSGVSFLPHSDHTYQQAPYEDCDEETYEALADRMPVIDWSLLSRYENEDNTAGSQTMACTGGVCEIVDLT
jgi:ribonucleoside-triphosphate reductase (thioredoxin)